MIKKTRSQIDQDILNFSFYMIQRGESGHRSGCKTNRYACSAGVLTIGYGTTIGKKHNLLNFTEETIDEKTAVFLARAEMHYKLYQNCRSRFPNKLGRPEHACFDTMLPCHQALVLDLAYQGKLNDAFEAALKNQNTNRMMRFVTNERNKERKAVRMRAVAMGDMIMKHKKAHPNQDPRQAAAQVAETFLKTYGSLKYDQAVTRDELALLYRSCMVAYKAPTTQQEAENFANTFQNVAVGRQGIGDPNRLDPNNLISGEAALKYLDPADHGNNPKDLFKSNGEKPTTYSTLAQGYTALVKRLDTISKKGPLTAEQLWRAYTGVRNVSGWRLMERIREKGLDIDENTKLDLKDPKVMEAVALSISETTNAGFPLGGKETAVQLIRQARGQTMPERQVRREEKPVENGGVTINVAPHPVREKPTVAKVQTPVTSSTYTERGPCARNQQNNPGRICLRGRTRRYATLKEGYEHLTTLLHNNYGNLSCQAIVKKFMGGNLRHTNTLVTYLRQMGIEARADTVLNLNDPKVLENLTIAMTKLRQGGQVLGGEEYARQCVGKKASKLGVQGDGVVITVAPQKAETAQYLAQVATKTPVNTMDVYQYRMAYERQA